MADDQQSILLSVLHLPQLYTKPTASSLLSTLSQLALSPISWDTDSQEAPAPISEEGIPSYLTRIISSSLSWVPSDAEKEVIWEAASQRLSERSGRSAMGSLTRTFKIPIASPPTIINGGEDGPETVDILLHEPALTGDMVGLKTWGASYQLAKRLHYRLPEYFPLIRKNTASTSRPVAPCHSPPPIGLLSPPPSPTNETDMRARVLELGAGTGLVGMAATSLFSVDAHLTDLPTIVPNLIGNVKANSAHFTRTGSTISASILDWRDLPTTIAEHEKYDIILTSDSLYDPQHPSLLANAMSQYLRGGPRSRIFMELPLRDMDLPYREMMRTEMYKEKGFQLLGEGIEVGYDDWQTWQGRNEVKCWWSVWGWPEAWGVVELVGGKKNEEKGFIGHEKLALEKVSGPMADGNGDFLPKAKDSNGVEKETTEERGAKGSLSAEDSNQGRKQKTEEVNENWVPHNQATR